MLGDGSQVARAKAAAAAPAAGAAHGQLQRLQALVEEARRAVGLERRGTNQWARAHKRHTELHAKLTQIIELASKAAAAVHEDDTVDTP